MEQIGKILENGDIEREFFRQGNIYKSKEAFDKKEGVCYVAELNDYKYTYTDFLTLANGDEEIAETIFQMVDWQCPETLTQELFNDNELIKCEECNSVYLGIGEADTPCSDCGHIQENI